MNKRLIYITLIAWLTLLAGAAHAEVRFAPQLERGAGAGYNGKQTDLRQKAPRSILKNKRSSQLHANLERTRSLRARQAQSRSRNTVKHTQTSSRRVATTRTAQQAARQGSYSPRKISQQRAAVKQVRFNTDARRAGSGYNNIRYDRRVAQPKSVLKGSSAHRAVRSERAFTQRLGANTRASMTHRGQVARHARKSAQYKSTLSRSGQVASKGRKLRSIGKMAGGGLVVYGAEQALGVNIPDAFEATEWTYNTLKSPKHAGRRVEKLGHDSVKTVSKGVRTLTNPKKMGRNIDRSLKKTARGINKLSCQAGKLFGARC